jgi:hypothetical protein
MRGVSRHAIQTRYVAGPPVSQRMPSRASISSRGRDYQVTLAPAPQLEKASGCRHPTPAPTRPARSANRAQRVKRSRQAVTGTARCQCRGRASRREPFPSPRADLRRPLRVGQLRCWALVP